MLDGRKSNGGARANSGRKAKTEKHFSAIESAEKRCADRLPTTLDNLETIADGRAEQNEEEWLAAGTVTVGKGAYVKSAFPDLPPEQLVLVRKKTVTFAPDVRANMYLSDRVMGKPSDGDEAKIQTAVEDAINTFLATLKQILPARDFEAVSAALSDGTTGSL